MLNLPRPTSYYFDTCRQIMWCRLSYDKLYILYSDDALDELSLIWRAALIRSLQPEPVLDVDALLTDTLQADDVDWRRLVGIVETTLDMESAVNDYFLGASAAEVIDGIEGGGYRG